jgi:hypothetical protein
MIKLNEEAHTGENIAKAVLSKLKAMELSEKVVEFKTQQYSEISEYAYYV